MRSVVLAPATRSWVWSALVAVLLPCGIATSSRAGLVQSDKITQGSILAVINDLDPIVVDLNVPVSATASRDGSGVVTRISFASNVGRVTAYPVPVTETAGYPVAGVQATVANGAASFVRQNGKLGGLMPLVGVSKVCLFGTCAVAVANVSVPLSVVGSGGTAFATGAVNVTVRGAPWTQGTATVGTITHMGNAGATTQMTTASGNISNTVSLVTPIFVSTDIAASAVVPVSGSLSFTLVSSVPEPGTLAAFGAAIVSLIGVGFARCR